MRGVNPSDRFKRRVRIAARGLHRNRFEEIEDAHADSVLYEPRPPPLKFVEISTCYSRSANRIHIISLETTHRLCYPLIKLILDGTVIRQGGVNTLEESRGCHLDVHIVGPVFDPLLRRRPMYSPTAEHGYPHNLSTSVAHIGLANDLVLTTDRGADTRIYSSSEFLRSLTFLCVEDTSCKAVKLVVSTLSAGQKRQTTSGGSASRSQNTAGEE